jgi:glycosyltransferase involved in cell wall biosynthesis
MKVVHIAPHLGGGVGKAHAAIGRALPSGIERTFVLLEQPRDRRHVEEIEAGGATVIADAGLSRVADLAAAADIVQFEFWNHPRLFECLARSPFPAMRTVFWSHISGLSKPVIPPGLIEAAGRFVFTTPASWSNPTIAKASQAARRNLAVINSGFGIGGGTTPRARTRTTPVIAYLGTVDFIKMHPGFFDAIDALEGGGLRTCVWGSFDPSGAVAGAARAMRRPERVHFAGWTENPVAALSDADIFFYPLRPDHYGTAENALVEAMSLGLVPVVMNNPAELAIVGHGETGLVARSIHECTTMLQSLIAQPELKARLSGNAMRYIEETRSPARSANDFLRLWRALRAEPKRCSDFRCVVGESPANWFLATQCLPGESFDAARRAYANVPAKGMLAHFESVFPGDASLRRLADAKSTAVG